MYYLYREECSNAAKVTLCRKSIPDVQMIPSMFAYLIEFNEIILIFFLIVKKDIVIHF